MACRPGFFLAVRVLSRIYRRLFLERLQAAADKGALKFLGFIGPLAVPTAFAAHLQMLQRTEWIVYCQTTVRRRAVGARLSRPLHPSRGYRQ